jgi:dTDP-glucose 4,6-dehydratase
LNSLNLDQVEILENSILSVFRYLDFRRLVNKRLFITGGTGFFGLWLLSALSVLHQKSTPFEVTVLSRNPENFLTRHPQFRKLSWLSFIVGNVSNFQIPQQNFDLILHAAAETSMEAHAEPLQMFDNIVFGTRRVLEFAQLSGVSRILLVSSGAVYGKQLFPPIHQLEISQSACNPLLPISAYGEGKRVMELMGAIHHHKSGIEFIVARCFSFCGPGLPLDKHFAIGNFIYDALYSKKITIEGDGSPMRSYLYGADLAVWLLNLLLNGKSGQSYNVGSAIALTIEELATIVRDTLSPNKSILISNSSVTSSSHSCYVPSIERARVIGCEQWTSIEDSLRHTANYYQLSKI